MIADINVGEAFHVAQLLTGNMQAAERAVSDAIATSDCGVTEEQLLLASAKYAIQLSDRISPMAEVSSSLPLELQRLFLLSRVCRDCFVLRILMGLNAEMSSRVLNLPREEMDEGLCLALSELSRFARTESGAAKGRQAALAVGRQAPPMVV